MQFKRNRSNFVLSIGKDSYIRKFLMLAKIQRGENVTPIQCRKSYFILESKLPTLKMYYEYSTAI